MSKKKQQQQTSPPWPDLTPELLAMVFLCLPRRADRVFFTAVCRAWRTAVQQCRQLQPPSPMPWLVLPDGSITRFPCGSETLHLPDGVRCHNSCGEWLLLSRSDGSCFLMNPFTKATMLLPKLSSYKTYSDPSVTTHQHRHFERMWTDLKDISNISVLSLVVCSKRLIAVLVTNSGRLGTLALCRPGDAAWSMGANMLYRYLFDIVFFRGKLYAIGFNNDLRVIEIAGESSNDEPRVSRTECIFTGVPIITSQCYLVESSGRLLMICRKINCRREAVYCQGENSFILVARSSEFEVFEADFGRILWTKLRCLGDDQALFVGQGCSRASCVSPYDLSRDSIFFVDDYTSLVSKKITTSCGVYDMKDGKVYPTLPMVSWMSGDIRATWLFYEESMTNGLQLTGEHLQELVEKHRMLLPCGTASSSAASTSSC